MWPFQRKTQATADPAATLAAACAGLAYPSERDTPFDVVRWPASRGSAAEAVARRSSADATIETVALRDFFDALSADRRFVRLADAVRATLDGALVVRASQVRNAEVQVYVIGRTTTGEWLALHTTSIET